jgi:spore protease
LGNENITPDSIGPKTVEKLLVTRHIETIDSMLFKSAGFGCVAAISPGVLGQTGIESAEIIKSICANIKPICVIVIDSLASRRLNRLATTVQLSDGGISPGSGVANKRAELSERTLGVPVVSIGVPTVVDAATLAYDLLEEHLGTDESFASEIEQLLVGEGKNMFVTPKDNDIIAEETAKLLSASINIALHNMEINEINEYLN